MKRKYCVPLLTILAVTWLAIAMSGCNTVKGIGKDITGAAETTERWLTGDDGQVYATHRPEEY